MEDQVLTWHERDRKGHKTGRTYCALKGEDGVRYIGYCDDKITKTSYQLHLSAPNLHGFQEAVGERTLPLRALGLVFFKHPHTYTVTFNREMRAYIAEFFTPTFELGFVL